MQSLANSSPDVDALFRIQHGPHMTFRSSINAEGILNILSTYFFILTVIYAVSFLLLQPFILCTRCRSMSRPLWSNKQAFGSSIYQLQCMDASRTYIFQALSKCTRQLVALHDPVVEHSRFRCRNSPLRANWTCGRICAAIPMPISRIPIVSTRRLPRAL
jgi:hypothetical protein